MPTSKGQALADEYGIKFFETVSPILSDVEIESFFGCSKVQVTDKWQYLLQSAKTNLNVEEVFFSIGKDIKQRLSESDSKTEVRR